MIIAILVVLALMGSGYYYMSKRIDNQYKVGLITPVPDYSTSTFRGVIATTTHEGGLTAKIKIEATVTNVTDCGSQDCFNKKFAACQPAKVKSTIFSNATYEYEIVGTQPPYCKVVSQFTANPNPAWVGKTMTCLYDSSKPFKTAVTDMSRCSGALYNLMVPNNAQPSGVPGCMLKSPYASVSLFKGVSSKIWAEGYSGDGSKVTWQSEDPSIAKVQTNTGTSVMLQSVSAGKTELVVTDNAIGPGCRIAIPVTITQ